MKTSFPKNKHEKMIPRATTYQLSNLRDLVEIGTSSTQSHVSCKKRVY